eukprot:5540848-Pyramimonas_sp.AAC.1
MVLNKYASSVSITTTWSRRHRSRSVGSTKTTRRPTGLRSCLCQVRWRIVLESGKVNTGDA